MNSNKSSLNDPEILRTLFSKTELTQQQQEKKIIWIERVLMKIFWLKVEQKFKFCMSISLEILKFKDYPLNGIKNDFEPFYNDQQD